MNWKAGWFLLLAGVLTGGFAALTFHRENYNGGYESFPRRLMRLGHVALAALGMVNLLYALSPWPYPWTDEAKYASYCFVLGGISMPTVCFMTSWFKPARHLFFIPVSLLVVAVIYTLKGGGP
jgi:hypothetical protein